MHPNWVPTLDGFAGFRRNSELERGLCWFERARFHAARVRNASMMGSHLRRVISLTSLCCYGHIFGLNSQLGTQSGLELP